MGKASAKLNIPLAAGVQVTTSATADALSTPDVRLRPACVEDSLKEESP